ncbi:MAG TPA: PHP domain-containing protein, partial [Candidatus Dormibacteraeota bacterium]|nr:PHP domain-containing protein [Candidatus Dormibacteraeota bacterium]
RRGRVAGLSRLVISHRCNASEVEHDAALEALSRAIDSLSEIAYLLRSRDQEAHRARAFGRVAAVLVRERPDLPNLTAVNRLEAIEGVGASIAKVLAEVVADGVSSYLEKLRAEAGVVLGPVSEISLSGYVGDLHCHSTWSDGKVSLAEMVVAARDRGYRYLAITDHSPHMPIVHGLDQTRLDAQAAEVEVIASHLPEIKILRGIEVDILEDGSLDLADEVLAGLDVVIASPHIKLRMDRGAMTERMLRAVENPHVDVLGHPTGRKPGNRPGGDYDVEAVFKRAAQCHTAVEMDCDPARVDLSPELARLAADLGCAITLDSDAHRPEEFDYVPLGIWAARQAGLSADQILNWLSPSDLDSWLAH